MWVYNTKKKAFSSVTLSSELNGKDVFVIPSLSGTANSGDW
jgi:hypothetical protein